MLSLESARRITHVARCMTAPTEESHGVAADEAPARPMLLHSLWTSLRPQAVLWLITLAAGILRFYGVGDWPVFIDEDDYTSTALEMLHLPWREAILRSSQVHPYKPPLGFLLQDWLIPLTTDPVVAGRVLSAAAGTITAALCFFLGRRLGGPGVGLVAAALYALSPVAVLHERMVLQDGPMAACALGAVLVSWAAIERRSWPLGGVAALLGALAVQFKVPAVATALLPIVILAVHEGPRARPLGPALLAAGGPLISYTALMRGPLGSGLAQENSERLAEPFTAFRSNLDVLLDSALTYFPAGLAFVVLVGAVLALWHRPRLAAVFLSAIIAWSAPWLVFSNFAPSRYYLPAVPYACALAALAMIRLPVMATSLGRAPGRLLAAGSLAILAASGIGSVQLVVSHRTAAMPKVDDAQYRSGWASGYGYAEAAYFVSTEAEPGSAVAYVVDPLHRVGVGFGRPSPTGVKILGFFHPPDQLRMNYRGPVYVVADDGLDTVAGRKVAEVLAREPGLHTLVRYTRPGSDMGVSVLRRP